MIEIPIDNLNGETAFDFSAELDGTTYFFELLWNRPGEYWSMHVMLNDGTIVAVGIVLVCNLNLLYSISKNAPKGVLICLRDDGSYERPTIETLGSSVKLYYASKI